jgi:dihydrodipicolinate synthase/N-acetylneuraminate lyase
MKAQLISSINELLQEGAVIPAHPLALNAKRELDENRQRLLTRYYLSSGAGGLAVGVHTTQFEIRKPGIDLLEPVLRITAEEVDNVATGKNIIKVAGITGTTAQAVREAELARKYGYHLGLVSMGGLQTYTETQLIDRLYAIAEIIPLFGFYLQPAVGGRLLSYSFWHAFSEIENLYAIKVAAFNRYQTLDVVRAVCNSGRGEHIALYTGNDDNIVADLLTPYRFHVNNTMVEKRFVGGLLGHWAVWTRSAVDLFKRIKESIARGGSGTEDMLSIGIKVTDMNAAIFDAHNSFHGCIPGIHEVLKRQGLLEGTWCLNPAENLSTGQAEEIERVCRAYPDLTDDIFVKMFLELESYKISSQ